MEESKVENLSEGRPPNPFSRSLKQIFNATASSCVSALTKKTTLVRHSSLNQHSGKADGEFWVGSASSFPSSLFNGTNGMARLLNSIVHIVIWVTEVSFSPEIVKDGLDIDFIPIVRSGAWGECGRRRSMEDAHVCFDDFMCDNGMQNYSAGPNAFYGIFDGHYGNHAAEFASEHLPRFVREDKDFPSEIDRVLSSAFLKTDSAFEEACSLDCTLESGTTALAALVLGRTLVVANAGDCRAVLCRRGKAVDLSQDHKPTCLDEQMRIESLGGFVSSDGYMNGDINVARALGDWHLKNSRGYKALIAEPELRRTNLTEVDEFLIMGCDGIWDVFSSQCAVDFARKKLQQHNDPVMCCKDLVGEAIFNRKSTDNVSAVVVCFQSKPPPKLLAPCPRVHRSVSSEGLKELQGFLDSLADGMHN